MNLTLSAEQLRRAADIKDRIDELETELSALLGGTAQDTNGYKRNMSEAGRARIAAAQRARWARFNAGTNGTAAHKPRRRMSTAAKARLAEIARARWRKAKAAGKTTL
jgi:hypothetical protein